MLYEVITRLQHVSQVSVIMRIVRVDLDGCLDQFERFIMLTDLANKHAKQVQGVWVAGV